MTHTLESLGIDKLQIAERIELIDAIWDSIETEPQQIDIPESHWAIVEQRLAAQVANPKAGSSWEDVKDRLQRKA